MKISYKTRTNLILRKLAHLFLQGLLFVSPLGITIFVIYKVFDFMDGILLPLIAKVLPFTIPGLGLLLMLILITVLGYIGKTVIAKPIKIFIERLLQKAPPLNMVYTSIRDFMEAFVGKEKKFNQPVLVKMGKEMEVERMGFLTQNDLSEMNIKDKVAVYLPYSYAFMGELLIVPSQNITSVDIPASEWMKFIVSGGVTRV